MLMTELTFCLFPFIVKVAQFLTASSLVPANDDATLMNDVVVCMCILLSYINLYHQRVDLYSERR